MISASLSSPATTSSHQESSLVSFFLNTTKHKNAFHPRGLISTLTNTSYFKCLRFAALLQKRIFRHSCFCNIEHSRIQGRQRTSDDSLVPSTTAITHWCSLQKGPETCALPCTPQANVTLKTLLNTKQEQHLEHAMGHMEHLSQPS